MLHKTSSKILKTVLIMGFLYRLWLQENLFNFLKLSKVSSVSFYRYSFLKSMSSISSLFFIINVIGVIKLFFVLRQTYFIWLIILVCFLIIKQTIYSGISPLYLVAFFTLMSLFIFCLYFHMCIFWNWYVVILPMLYFVLFYFDI